MNTGRTLNDVFAQRAILHRQSEEERGEEDGDIEEDNIPVQRPQQPTIMDMLMNGGGRSTTSSIITVGGSSNVSPAVLDYMRVTQQDKQQGAQTAAPLESVPLDEMFHARYNERLSRIAGKIDEREIDEYDEVDEEEEDDNAPQQRHMDDMLMEGGDEEDDLLMNDLFGGNNRPQIPPPRKKQRTSSTKKKLTKEGCFLCAFGDRFHDGIRAPHIARLVQIIDKFYGIMTNFELATALHLYYKEHIYNEEEGTQMLEIHVILEHIEGRHSLAALNFIVESIHDYEQVKFIAKGCLCKTDGSLDHRAFAIFDKAQSKLEKLYTMNIEKMNFNNGQTVEDLNSKGAYFNLMPMFSQKEEQHRRLKRKASAIESATNTFDL